MVFRSEGALGVCVPAPFRPVPSATIRIGSFEAG